MMHGHGRGALDRAPLDRPAQVYSAPRRLLIEVCFISACAALGYALAEAVWLIVGAVT